MKRLVPERKMLGGVAEKFSVKQRKELPIAKKRTSLFKIFILQINTVGSSFFTFL